MRIYSMRGVALSAQTRRRLEALFPIECRARAEALLVEECGANLPFQADATPETLERIRFATLKLSRGTVDGLCEAVQLAQLDWRDLLVAAEFADDVRAHERWMP